ncbi:glucans biosynthesis glucosyltransferase MdoH [Ancylobacter terrae]|uniref:glucans biosynthesis glucosyltransferase MdoH n=1 Tax=Ancylobacter sp. sgz301288 TaxID=3342077 RepID=UPI00385BD58B
MSPNPSPASSASLDRVARQVRRRRIVFGAVVTASWIVLVAVMVHTLRPGGLGLLDALLIVLFGLWLPWPLMGFWNGLIGFVLMRFARDPVGLVCPSARQIAGDEAIRARTAVLVCVRNEAPERVFDNARALLSALAATPWGDRFRLHVLSDTDQPDIAAAEAAAVRDLHIEGTEAPVYRRRTRNEGFKAGSIRQFVEHEAGDADFMLVLDADSRMSAARILRMVRIMQADPRLGILQSLAVGLPSLSPLARLFQFGMRLGMRSYTFGSAWWHGDCGPYWGHNALLRIEPFRRHCELPALPGRPPLGGAILSHDQVEAVLMRRAGFDVRVLPEEGGSYEENPPTLIEHMRRDMRWCVGNMQYLRLLNLPGLLPTSRVQLGLAILMFLASPVFLAIWALLLVQALIHRAGAEPWLSPDAAAWLLAVVAAIIFMPKLASAADVLSRRAASRGFGGAGRFVAGFCAETVFALLVTPIAAMSHTLTIAGLLLRRGVGWGAQARDTHRVGWGEAARRFWPHTLAGGIAASGLAGLSPLAPLYAAPIYLGLLLAVPLAVVTASPALGRWMAAMGLCAIPEEVTPPPTEGVGDSSAPICGADPAPAATGG